MHKFALSFALLAIACDGQGEDPGAATDAGSGSGGASSGAPTGGSGASGGSTAGSAQGGVSGSATGGSAGVPSGGAGAGLGGASGASGAAGAAAVGGASGASGAGPLGGTSGGGAGGSAGTAGTGGSSGSGGKAGAGGTGGGALCATRTGGALIDMTIAGESLRLWITNTAFINEMSQNVGREAPRQPILDLLDGQDCDPQYTWHANPSTARFATAQMDICAAWPSVVEDNKDLWVNSDWCPEMAHVVAVTRR